MSRTMRRTHNSAIHYKKGALEKPSTYKHQIRNRPYSSFKSGELQSVVEVKFHTDNFPTLHGGDNSFNRRRKSRKLRHMNKTYVHDCLYDENYSTSHLAPCKKDINL